MATVTKRDTQGRPLQVVLTKPEDIELWGAIHAARKLRDGRNGVFVVELALGAAGSYRCTLRGRDGVIAAAESVAGLRDAIDWAWAKARIRIRERSTA